MTLEQPPQRQPNSTEKKGRDSIIDMPRMEDLHGHEFSPEFRQVARDWVIELGSQINTGYGCRTLAGSGIEQDDRKAKGGLMSETTQLLLGAAVDHLRSAMELREQPTGVPPFAIASLLRGALEISGALAWLLEPESSNERSRRLLRLQHEDTLNEYQFGGDKAHRDRTTEKIKQITERLHGDKKQVTMKPTSTMLMQHLDSVGVEKSLAMWRLLSGFAHGRRWAMRVGTESTELSVTSRGTTVMRISASRIVIDAAISAACGALDYAIGRWNLLSGNIAARTWLNRWPEDDVGAEETSSQ